MQLKEAIKGKSQNANTHPPQPLPMDVGSQPTSKWLYCFHKQTYQHLEEYHHEVYWLLGEAL